MNEIQWERPPNDNVQIVYSTIEFLFNFVLFKFISTRIVIDTSTRKEKKNASCEVIVSLLILYTLVMLTAQLVMVHSRHFSDAYQDDKQMMGFLFSISLIDLWSDYEIDFWVLRRAKFFLTFFYDA